MRRAIELSLGEKSASRVKQARILLVCWEDPSFFWRWVGALGLHDQAVQRCVEGAVAEGRMAALDDRPRPGQEPRITPRRGMGGVAWRAGGAKDLGYPKNCGRPGFSPVTLGSAGRRVDVSILAVLGVRFQGRSRCDQ
jgi:hypothetical protein